MKTKLKTWTIGAFTLAASLFLYASETAQPVLEIENDMNENSTRLVATRGHLSFRCENANTGKTTTVALEFGPEGDQTLTLFERDGREVILIEAVDFRPDDGGTLLIHYLSNGVRDKWDSIELTLARGEKGWTARYRDAEVARMRVEARRIFGKVIGIQEISPI